MNILNGRDGKQVQCSYCNVSCDLSSTWLDASATHGSPKTQNPTGRPRPPVPYLVAYRHVILSVRATPPVATRSAHQGGRSTRSPSNLRRTAVAGSCPPSRECKNQCSFLGGAVGFGWLWHDLGKCSDLGILHHTTVKPTHMEVGNGQSGMYIIFILGLPLR